MTAILPSYLSGAWWAPPSSTTGVLVRDAATGEPVPELAQAFGISRATAYRYLAKPSSPSGAA